VDLFYDSIPDSQIWKPFSQSSPGLARALGMFRCHFWLQIPFSPGGEDTSSGVSFILKRSAFTFACYLALIGYFKSRGGYKPVQLTSAGEGG
jgi:hypothetical protein